MSNLWNLFHPRALVTCAERSQCTLCERPAFATFSVTFQRCKCVPLDQPAIATFSVADQQCQCSILINVPAPRSMLQNSKASVLRRSIDLPSTSLRFPWLRGEHGSGQSKRCASSSHRFFEIACSPPLADEAFSDYRQLTDTPGSLAAKTSRITLWKRQCAELGHQPYPLTPVLVVKIPAVLRKACYLYICEAQQQNWSLLGRRSDI